MKEVFNQYHINSALYSHKTMKIIIIIFKSYYIDDMYYSGMYEISCEYDSTYIVMTKRNLKLGSKEHERDAKRA